MDALSHKYLGCLFAGFEKFPNKGTPEISSNFPNTILQFQNIVCQFLAAWRERKGETAESDTSFWKSSLDVPKNYERVEKLFRQFQNIAKFKGEIELWGF